MTNLRRLTEAELNAIRSLQQHPHLAEADDPIWEGLADLGLVQLRYLMRPGEVSLARFAMLTARAALPHRLTVSPHATRSLRRLERQR